jgi:hypothetical protein
MIFGYHRPFSCYVWKYTMFLMMKSEREFHSKAVLVFTTRQCELKKVLPERVIVVLLLVLAKTIKTINIV